MYLSGSLFSGRQVSKVMSTLVKSLLCLKIRFCLIKDEF